MRGIRDVRLTPEADMFVVGINVCYVPQADILLFDAHRHLTERAQLTMVRVSGLRILIREEVEFFLSAFLPQLSRAISLSSFAGCVRRALRPCVCFSTSL